MNNNKIAGAIVFGALLVAAAVILRPQAVIKVGGQDLVQGRESNINEYGDKVAPIRIVEYSDFECPYCSKLHPTLKKLVDESNGQVIWEYRHLPLQNHSFAREAAILSECVAQNNRAEFWTIADELLANNAILNSAYLESLAVKYGITTVDYKTCLSDPKIANLIETDLKAAQAMGARGTPFSVIIYDDGKTKVVPGALPYEKWQTLLK